MLTRRISLALWLMTGAHPALAAPQWQFDPDLVRGTGLNEYTLQRFNQADTLLPGIWPMELYVNGELIARLDISFAENEQGEVRPCLARDLWLRAGVDAASIRDTEGECPLLAEQVPGSSSALDPAQMRLSLTIPQSLMRRSARTAVNLERLDAGRSILFFNYLANGWHTENTRGVDQNAAYLSLTGGANFGLWQYRQKGNLSMGTGHGPHWHNQSSYLQRPLPALVGGSQLLIGQLQTSGRYFSGLAHTGVNLASDERVLADQLRGYAPVVRGVANTNALIIVTQKGQKIYQTTVVPGAFVINDLAPTSYNGDIKVEIHEADGSVRSFSVPFSALPESLRPGHWRYALAAGRTRQLFDESGFIDASYQFGLSNRVSLGGGARFAPGYQALAAEAVTSSRIGALGFSLNGSHANLPKGARAGWMAGLSYSRSFTPTDTHLAIAAYRYSSTGYRELGDLLVERGAQKRGQLPSADLLHQRSRLDLSLSQNLGQIGHLYVSASALNWHNSPQRERQWQLGYGVNWPDGASLNLSLQRLVTNTGAASARAGVSDLQFSMSVSVPLGGSRASLSSSFSHDLSGSQFDNDMSGSLSDSASYNLGASYSYLDAQRQHQTGWHGSVQQRLPMLDIGANASRSPHHWQAAANVQGALVLHPGGLTLGPALGDTFALVEAKGATGATVSGTGQARIDRNGYALVPSLTPYRDNRVFVAPEGAADDVELEDGEQHVAPYPGAAVKLTFHARHGEAALIHIDMPNDQQLPPGIEAVTPEGEHIGMLGQHNWLYLRSEQPQGQVRLRWGDHSDEQCRLRYDLSHAPKAPVRRLHAACLPRNTG